MSSDYGMQAKMNVPYEEAVEQATAALKEEGFGILTEIDVKETFKKKLDVDFRKYRILGACNPKMAHHALSIEDKIAHIRMNRPEALNTMNKAFWNELPEIIHDIDNNAQFAVNRDNLLRGHRGG